MSYRDRIATLRRAGDVASALVFLEGVFKADGNQKIRGSASDYLHDDGDDHPVTPSQGFDQIVAGFAPHQSVEDKVAFMLDRLTEDGDEPPDEAERTRRAERTAMLDLFRPLNAIAFRIGDYERCDAVADSGFYDPAAHRFERFYGLNHELVHDHDSREDYDFVYELEQGDQYKLALDGETLAGNALYYDLKVTLFSRYILTLVDAMVTSARFAGLKKALPFHVLIRSAEYRDDSWSYCIATIDEATLAGNPLAPEFFAARPPRAEPTLEQRFGFLANYVDEPDTAEYSQLTALVADHRDRFEQILAHLGDSLAQGRGQRVAALSRWLWTVAGRYESEVLTAQERIFAAPLPSLAGGGDYAGSGPSWRHSPSADAPVLELVNHRVEDHLRMLRACMHHTPDSFEPQVAAWFEAALATLRQHDVAAVRVLAMEAAIDPDAFENDVPVEPTDEYIAAVVASIDLLASSAEHGWEASGFVADRLAGLGERAAAGIPALIAKLELRSRDRLDETDVRQFAPVLYAMGCEQVPDVVHRTHNSNQFYIDDYAAWCRRGPDRAWQRLAQAHAESPEQFASTAAWEQFLYDSETGYKTAAAKLRETGLHEAALEAARAAPAGPKLNRQLVALAELIERTRGRAKDYARALEYLEAVSAPDEATLEFAMWARIAVALEAVERREEGVASCLAQLRAQYPDNATALFLDVDREARFGDLTAAMRLFVAGLPAIIGDDLVYNTAVCELAGVRSPDALRDTGAPMSHRDAYPLYKVASDRFRDRCFTAGEFDGIDNDFKRDPFYQSIYTKLDGQRTQVAALLDDYRQEWDFTQDSAALDDAALVQRLDPENWPRSLAIARRLTDSPSGDNVEALVEFLPRLEATDHRRQLAFMLWRHDPDALLRTDAFRALIPTFVRRYPGSAAELAREVVARLAALGLVDEALAVPFELGAETTLTISKTVLPLFFRVERFDRAAELYEQVAGNIRKLKPEWTLAMGSLAVVHIHAKAFDKADDVFGQVFSQDTDRFAEGEDCDASKAIVGESVAHQAARRFWHYWAMARFNQACMYALTDRADAAMDSLRDAVARGSYEADYILAEPDFESLRDRDDFDQLIASMRKDTP